MENGSKAQQTKEHILGDQHLVPSRTVSPRYQVPEEMPAERPWDFLAYLDLVRADRTLELQDLNSTRHHSMTRKLIY